jgi:hypothetical protein
MQDSIYNRRITISLTDRQLNYVNAEAVRLGNMGISTFIRMMIERDRRDSVVKRIV